MMRVAILVAVFCTVPFGLAAWADTPAAAVAQPNPLASPSGAPQPGRVDFHLHVTMDRAAKPFIRGEPGKGALSGTTGGRTSNEVSEKGLRDNHLVLALCALWPPFSIRPGLSAFDESIRQLDQLRAFVLDQPGFAVATDVAQAREVVRAGRIALVPALEGGEGIDTVDDVDRLWARGARMVTLVHFSDTQVGGSADGQLASNFFGSRGKPHNKLGLSELGKAAVERMAELGMIVDLAHASDATVLDTLEILDRHRVPALISHTGIRELAGTERNISAELARRIVDAGGMVGVPLYFRQVANVPVEARFENFQSDSCDEVVAHWLRLAQRVGAEAVTLGSDFNGFIVRPGKGGACPKGLRSTEDLDGLYGSLVSHGIPPEALDGEFERFLSMWAKVESKASATARQHARSLPVAKYDLFDVP